MVFNGLVRFVPGNSAEIEPDLATAIPEPEMVDGKQVWTFTLRDDVMCQPGPDTEAYALTADDVVYSLQKSADVDRSAYAGDYAGMTVEKVDDHTVTITMDTPLSADPLPAEGRQLRRRLHRLQQGGRGDGRRSVQDPPGRHRTVHVRELHPAEQRGADRQ